MTSSSISGRLAKRVRTEPGVLWNLVVFLLCANSVAFIAAQLEPILFPVLGEQVISDVHEVSGHVAFAEDNPSGALIRRICWTWAFDKRRDATVSSASARLYVDDEKQPYFLGILREDLSAFSGNTTMGNTTMVNCVRVPARVEAKVRYGIQVDLSYRTHPFWTIPQWVPWVDYYPGGRK